MKKLWKYLKKIFTYNYCDSCGLTADEVFLVDEEHYRECPHVLCQKCIDKTKSNHRWKCFD